MIDSFYGTLEQFFSVSLLKEAEVANFQFRGLQVQISKKTSSEEQGLYEPKFTKRPYTYPKYKSFLMLQVLDSDFDLFLTKIIIILVLQNFS